MQVKLVPFQYSIFETRTRYAIFDIQHAAIFRVKTCQRHCRAPTFPNSMHLPADRRTILSFHSWMKMAKVLATIFSRTPIWPRKYSCRY